MRSNNKLLASAVLMLSMIGGGLLHAQPGKTGAGRAGRGMVADAPAMIGPPYAIGGVTYTPTDPAAYDEVGYAGRSDEGSQNGATANGEPFVASAISAAHRTLPLPSYVEVTALDSGKTILVRANDRGPMRNDQIIALSPGAAAQLGVSGAGVVPVRVRRVNPPEQERAVLRAHGRAAERLETPAALLKVLREKLPHAGPEAAPALSARAKTAIAPTKSAPAIRPGADFDQATVPAPSRPAPSRPAAKPAPAATTAAPARGGYVVQVGAFSTQARAETLAKSIGAHVEPGGAMWRVRFGPYPTQQAAQAGVRAAATKGFENARIMANDAR
ncbi:septal ring lytic transglycosylase RlpA family lipoprotein [Sphingobium lactosutens]|uniref:septal ring lytic transglycosylase RlpA family protein n=1 Tax=Sphingobium lactosutens TaxID=522773 RepID=UPI0015BE1BE0|nr:RlpA-like double-psi beta-barrel domain-containing protein [Sphingobium lactosutens]NWK96547.1 septal ring lytic transglycosylase RlpA family lipoprotein [Sphingobium lactosutens]